MENKKCCERCLREEEVGVSQLSYDIRVTCGDTRCECHVPSPSPESSWDKQNKLIDDVNKKAWGYPHSPESVGWESWEDRFWEKFGDKGDERFGLAKHNNTIIQHQVDFLRDEFHKAFEAGRKAGIEEVEKSIREELEEDLRKWPEPYYQGHRKACFNILKRLAAISTLLK